ncbi:IS5 family transposase [Candidatus Woesearchaeota archaeon]|nr:IS5 family transposase [Candidatus Woesearchaeota archaeon]
MKIIVEKFKKVADFCYELFKIAELQLYSHKFSKKKFSQFQHMFLLIYKQFRKFTYEELLTDIAGNSDLRAYLGLNKLPHYTTLIKFAGRLPCKVLDKLVLAFKHLFPKPKKVAIDATGISLDNASLHYCKRIGKSFKKRPFMKTTFIVDIENYFILLVKMRKKTRHDVIDAKPMIKKLALHYEPEVFYGDRGYDANSIFQLCFEKLKAYPLILQRNLDVPKHRRKGEYRKQTFDVFDYGEYLQRNKIETLNSMIKRRFSSNVKSRTDKLQRVEILTRVIAYNIDRLIRTGKVILIILRITRISY